MKARITSLLCLIVLAALPALSSVLPPLPVPNIMYGGATPQASDWSAMVQYSSQWLSSYVVPALNCVTAKGDIYVYNGTGLTSQGVGANGVVLQAASNQSTGIKWTAYTGAAPLTTKGDILGFDGSTINRFAVGTNNYALGCNAAAADGITWINTADSGSIFPTGTVNPWSPAGAGTSTIPSGWVLCDGNNGSPNLIGLFVLGTRPNGSSASPATGGYGGQTADAAHMGSTAHTHTFTTVVGNTGAPSSTFGQNAGSNPVWIVSSISHGHTIPTMAATSSSATYEPSDYALVYIMKQ